MEIEPSLVIEQPSPPKKVKKVKKPKPYNTAQ